MKKSERIRVRDHSLSDSDENGRHIFEIAKSASSDNNKVNALDDIPEDEKVQNYAIGVHNHNHMVSKDKSRRNSYSLKKEDFDSEEDHRRYVARKRWRKVKIFMKAMHKFSRRETYHYVDSSGSVFWKIKLLYSLPQFSLISLTMLINIQVIVFYNEVRAAIHILHFSDINMLSLSLYL